MFSDGARALYQILLDYLSCRTGQCNPSNRLLARRTGKSERTVRKLIAALRQGGWVNTRQTRGTASYSFPLDRTADDCGEVVHHVDRRSPVNQERRSHAGPKRQNLAGAGRQDSAGPYKVNRARETENPQKPPRGRRRVTGDLVSFDRFWDPYPTTPTMSRKRAENAWRQLDHAERNSAIEAVGRYVRDCKETQRKTCDPATFLRDRRFDGYEGGPGIAAPGRSQAFVKRDDPLWRPLADRFRSENGRPPPCDDFNGGWWFDLGWVRKLQANSSSSAELAEPITAPYRSGGV